MLIPKEEPRLDGHLYLRKSLHNLRKSIQSLLGSKQDLTCRWAESVRYIIEDISAECKVPDSPSWSGPLETVQESSKNTEDDICKLEAELAKLRTQLKEEDSLRRLLHNEYLDLKGKKKAFQLDKVFAPAASQDDVFAEVGPLIRSALDGHNVCIFAYGQTGAGKTFTMEGTKDSPGIVPRSLQLLFHQSSLDCNKRYDFTFSMLELYMGSMRDLLVSNSRRISESSPSLSIQMDPRGGVEVENLTEYIVKDVYEASQLYLIGSKARATAKTNSNAFSSRSHCLIRITMASYGQSCPYPVLSKLWLIDLGGSERLLKTDAKGRILEEGKAINLSLSALGDVISALQRRQSHIPYRNSKLTQILRDSLGEDAKTIMLVHVSSREEDVSETTCTLTFATRARGIHLGKELSLSDREERTKAMNEVKKRLEGQESTCEHLQGQIHELEFLCRKKKMSSKREVEETKDKVTLQSTVLSRKAVDRRDIIAVSKGMIGIPRFMKATTSSRLKGRPEGCHGGSSTMKYDKTAKSKKKHLMGYRRGAKVSPLDTNSANDQDMVDVTDRSSHAVSDNKLHLTAYEEGSEVKMQNIVGLSKTETSGAMNIENEPQTSNKQKLHCRNKKNNVCKEPQATITTASTVRLESKS
ncbi:hypothetical protein KP509_10G083700 [Ceratopteris richardii]|uniref:Kinesin motor domain-containing protein n=1 Tax=Ceratopteris richardii TaxID=49495 RepID=A0A8T2U3E3_CERRI|nr:hypothetical protein KP509_10G083700 [Ceratopteris richardii]